VRRRLGRIAYVHDARSWTIDPHRFADWYHQTVRWSWGQFQSIRGHKLGSPIQRSSGSRFGIRFSWFDTAYFAVLLDWMPYMLEPLIFPIVVFLLRGWIDPLWFVAYFLVGSVAWIVVAAIALRKPRLVILAPALIVLDLVYRVAMMHALVKAIFSPTVEVCRWDSPARFQLEQK
jgi:poly-beta-1,6-N-acetyl-D-glucosamine synthase